MSEHYKSHPSGIEAIEITQYESFLRGNIIKYIMRAPYKGDELADLEKAAEYLQWEIERVKEEQFWAKFDEGVVKPRLADLLKVEPVWDDETAKSREKFEKRLSEFKEMRGEWDTNGEIAYVEVDGVPVVDKLPKFQRDIADYYRAGMTGYYPGWRTKFSNKTFDEVAFPDKCQECSGDCKVC